MIFALAAFTSAFAQENKNEKQETVVTKTAVKSEKGTDVSTKAVTKTENEVITLADSDAGQTNQTMVTEPAKISSDVNYGYEGNRFKFINQKDENGYRLMTVKDNATDEEYAVIKPTSQKGYYILSKDGTSSFGYFNADGNFVVESYDAKNDVMVSNIYKLEMNKETMNNMNKQ